MTDDGREQARKAVLEHVDCWNACDKERWLRIFAADVVYEDPPGTVVGRGRQVMSDYAWDRSFTDDKRWILEPWCSSRAATRRRCTCATTARSAAKPTWVDSIELWQVDDAGLVSVGAGVLGAARRRLVRSHLVTERVAGGRTGFVATRRASATASEARLRYADALRGDDVRDRLVDAGARAGASPPRTRAALDVHPRAHAHPDEPSHTPADR